MRASAIAILAVGSVAGCGKGDPCSGAAGTCVALTVQSSTVSVVDSLQIGASGAITATHESAGFRSSLPVRVALKFPPSASGALHLDVNGLLSGALVGTGATDTTLIPGQHTNASVTLDATSGGTGFDLSTTTDMAGTSSLDMPGAADMRTAPCDPKGVTGPQCVWRWQTPLPQGEDLVGIVAFSDIDTFAMSNQGLILHRDATGWTSLRTRPVVANSSITSISLFGSGNQLFVSGAVAGAAAVFHSADKGVTWSSETLPAGVGTTFLSGAAGNAGLMAVIPNGSSPILVRDAAGTWTGHVAGTGTYYAAAIDNSGNAVAVGGVVPNGAVAYTTNGGSAWTQVATPPSVTLRGACTGGTSFWAVGDGGIFHATVTAGLSTWTQQSSAATSSAKLTGCVATDDQHAWAFGQSGVVFYTTDGVTWMGVPSPPATTLNLLAGAHSATALTLVGQQGTIFRSTNGTSFSSELTGVAAPLSSVYGFAPSTVYAVGANGNVEYTVNGGGTWTQLAAPGSTGTSSSLNMVWGASASDLYAVGNAGTIIHSTNGTSFTKYTGVSVSTTATLLDVWGSTVGVYAAGSDGSGTSQKRVLYRSTDRGTSWTPLAVGGFTDVMGSGFSANTVFAIGSDVWVAGEDGSIYHALDGATFTKQTSGVTASISRIRGVSGDLFALFNTVGQYIRSSDGGAHWSAPITPFTDGELSMFVLPSESAIYVMGGFGGPEISVDKGQTWKALDTGIMAPFTMQGTFAFADYDVFVVAATGGIIHYGN